MNIFKTLRKPYLPILLASLILVVSCTTNDIISERVNITSQELSEDQIFLEIQSEMNEYSDYILTIIKNKSLSVNELNSNLKKLQEKGLSVEEQLFEMDKMFEMKISERVVENAIIISEKLNDLNNKYLGINEELLTNAFSKNIENQKSVAMSRDGCGWRYGLCIGAAYAGAVLCHAGCDTTALAFTAGFGIPACVALCGTLQVFASVQCMDSYCNY